MKYFLKVVTNSQIKNLIERINRKLNAYQYILHN